MPTVRSLVLTVTLLAGAAAPLPAQYAGPPVLHLPAGTRALAMGDAGVALGDVDALFQNPSVLAAARGLAGGASRYGAGATLLSVALAVPMAPGGLGLGVQHLAHASAGPGNTVDPNAGEGALVYGSGHVASASVLTLGFGRELDGVRVGIAGKWIDRYVTDPPGAVNGIERRSARGTAIVADVGVARRVGWATVAASAQNLGTRLRFSDGRPSQDLARRATLGVATEGRWVGPLDLSASAQLSYLEGNELVPGAGVELGYSPVEGYAVAGRVGVRRAIGDGVAPVSLGAALSRDRVTIEYAFQSLNRAGDLHRVGLRLHP